MIVFMRSGFPPLDAAANLIWNDKLASSNHLSVTATAPERRAKRCILMGQVEDMLR